MRELVNQEIQVVAGGTVYADRIHRFIDDLRVISSNNWGGKLIGGFLLSIGRSIVMFVKSAI